MSVIKVEMKIENDLFQLDDEENQAEGVSKNLDDEAESESKAPEPNYLSTNLDLNNSSWPRSYRKSMDMLSPPSVSFMRKNSLTDICSSFSTTFKRRPQISQNEQSLSKPFISETSAFKEELPTLTEPLKLTVSSCSKISHSELPPSTGRKCSFSQAVLNTTNLLCGIGLLTTPYAVREGGWFSLILLVMFGIICCHTGILLQKCLESSPRLHSYPDIGEAAFGIYGRLGISVSIILCMELYAACVEFIILMGDNLSSLFPKSYLSLAGINLESHHIFAITATLVVLPTVWLRNLSLISYLSVGGIFASILVALSLLWVGVVDQVGFHPCGKALDLSNIPVAVGIYGFAFAGHSVIPNIYTSMKEPSQFPSALITSFGFCILMYIGVAILGFLIFGDSVKSQFTLSMPKELPASGIAAWITVVIPLTKYPLTILPVALSIEELIPWPKLRCYAVSVLLRTILVFSTLVVALSIPFFGSLLALNGSLMAMLVALIFPCACSLRLLSGRLTKVEIASCILIMVVGLVCSIIGTYSAIIRIADKVD
ncbi:vacuolar amino acid transporter 1 [Quillaja saponaria]|uniref:Vacuolar amino acid transporter 1 n=1 Tax=Quillaja saponaria TaxID=32244 RepID=A0AAD7L281_QUISA|nr:vacuolar amino acid transporter 1 [Quillaja saponaria]